RIGLHTAVSIKAYLSDKTPFLLINFILFVLAAGLMLLINIRGTFILLMFCIWFFPVVTYIIMEFVKQKMLYDELNRIMENLDKKYLLSEIMKEPEHIEGKLLYELLREANKDMHEHVKSYRETENEYRKYIETWVTEIKTSIASSRLIIENNQNPVTQNINDEIKKIEEYIEQVLYYSRSNNVRKDYLIQEVSLPELVRTVIRKNSRDFINRGIAVDIEAVAGIVYSDAKWLEFILNQLIGNAIKYNRKQDGEVKFEAIRNERNIVLSIKDNGIGMIDKDRNRVFEKGFT